MSDLTERLRNHERHAVHDYDDDCIAAADEIEKLTDLCRELSDWFEAYPEDIFTPLQGDPIKKTGDYDTAEKRNLITRAASSMARHMIERIPEKIKTALQESRDE